MAKFVIETSKIERGELKCKQGEFILELSGCEGDGNVRYLKFIMGAEEFRRVYDEPKFKEAIKLFMESDDDYGDASVDDKLLGLEKAELLLNEVGLETPINHLKDMEYEFCVSIVYVGKFYDPEIYMVLAEGENDSVDIDLFNEYPDAESLIKDLERAGNHIKEGHVGPDEE